jgi:hypothetical protein
VTSGRRSRLARLAPIFVVATFVAVAPPAALGHVNRTVGKYTILVTLIGEPYFATNRAGFEIWVKDAGRPVVGLDGSIQPEAIRAGRTVRLVLAAMPDAGHYQAEFGPDGQAFDPLGGGAWSLRLTGSIEGLAVDETFPVTFPVYPRVLAASPQTQGGAGQPPIDARASTSDQSIAPILGIVVATLLGVCAAFVVRRRAKGPTPAS